MKQIIILLTIFLLLLHTIPLIAYEQTKNSETFGLYIGLGIIDIFFGVFIDNSRDDI